MVLPDNFTEYPIVPKPALPGWLSLSNVLTIITLAVGGLWVIATMNTAQAVQNTQIATLEKSMERDRVEVKALLREQREEIRAELQELRSDVRELLQRTSRR